MLFFILHSCPICWAGEESKLFGAAFGSFRAEEGAIPEKSAALDSMPANPVCDAAVTCVPDNM